MSERKIVVNGVTWTWQVGKSCVLIRDANRKSHQVGLCDLTGMSSNDLERAAWKRYLHIRPAIIAEYIQKRMAANA